MVPNYAQLRKTKRGIPFPNLLCYKVLNVANNALTIALPKNQNV